MTAKRVGSGSVNVHVEAHSIPSRHTYVVVDTDVGGEALRVCLLEGMAACGMHHVCPVSGLNPSYPFSPSLG